MNVIRLRETERETKIENRRVRQRERQIQTGRKSEKDNLTEERERVSAGFGLGCALKTICVV